MIISKLISLIIALVCLANGAHAALSCKDYDLTVPCADVPKCDGNKNFATLTDFKVSDSMSDVPAKQNTTVKICYSPNKHFKVHTVAQDVDVFSPYTSCNSQVWVNSDVLEVFMAPTATPFNAPIWYYEMDTSPSNAMWVGHKNNSRGNWSNCNDNDDCVAGPIECSGLDSFPQFPPLAAHVQNISSTGWGVELTVPFEMFPPKYQDSRIWRANFYRYDYPENREKYELSGWSPTHDPSFHVPQRFGVMVLES